MPTVKPQTPSYQAVLISACLLLVLSFGYRAGFGLFMVPMSDAREWGRDVFGLALAVQNLSWGVCAILAGALADKYGNLRVLLGGVALYAIGMLGMSLSSTETQIVSTAGLLVGAGIAGTSFGIVLPSIARAVPEENVPAPSVLALPLAVSGSFWWCPPLHPWWRWSVGCTPCNISDLALV